MNRKQFIDSVGGDSSWSYAWSFLRPATNTVIFAAWDVLTDNGVAEILCQDWERESSGKFSGKFTRSREHIRLVEEEGWELQVFEQIKGDERDNGTWTIASGEDWQVVVCSRSNRRRSADSGRAADG
jgi:5-methylcytosine-specific restriction protein A